MVSRNIHSKELFDQVYGSRKPSFYAGLLSQVILHGKPGSILDLGAGLGLFVELAHKWGLNVTGLEGSTYAVKEARSRVGSIKMFEGDLANPLPLADRAVANVVLNQVIEHLDHETFRNVLSECHRVLEGEGKIFIYSPSKRNTEEKSEPTHVNLMLPSELKRDLEANGFEIVRQPNDGFWFASSSGVKTNYISRILLRLFPHDWISASTNAIAVKLERPSSEPGRTW
jgi:SAM-dependent methyltransferase